MDSEDLGTVFFFQTKDLVRYEEKGFVKLADGPIQAVRCAVTEDGKYALQWQQSNGHWYEKKLDGLDSLKFNDANAKLVGMPIQDSALLPANMPEIAMLGIQGAVPCNSIEIPDELGQYLLRKLLPATHVGVAAPKELRKDVDMLRRSFGDGSVAEKVNNALGDVMIDALYSDGTRVPKHVIWNEESLTKVDFSKPGRYALKGKLTQPHFEFPICTDRADPCVCRWNGKYYYIATNDADYNHTLYMRCADSLEGIRDAEEHLILDSTTYEGIGGLLWAPEFHVIDGRMYLFHACTPGPFFCEESHVMELREGGDPLKKEDWSRPKRVVKADGSDICEAGKEITLDMTEFEWQGELYVIWSQRQFLPKDLGAWLYIAKLNREKPWMLASDSVVLSKPEYGWANNHTFVDEGPFALIRGDKLYVTFSSAAVDSTYVVGLLQIEASKDLLNPANWRKNNYPLFTSRSYEGEYGTGHNAYVIDEDGTTWNTYHARPGVDGPRSTGIRRVHFDVDCEPMLDVIEELDLKPEYSEFETTLVIS
jgi:GH43 family beta-xylosidase